MENENCMFKTYQDGKCTHVSNPARLKIGSCTKEMCPLKSETVKTEPEGARTEPQPVRGNQNHQQQYRRK